MARFTTSANNITAGTTVLFTNGSKNADGYEWYINNVLQFTQADFSHTFTSAGMYIIRLTAITGNPQCSSAVMYDTVTVTCPVQADFSPKGKDIMTGSTVNFINASSGASSFEWQVNNVPQTTTAGLSYTFNSPANYSIKLIAKNTICNDTLETTINVITPCSDTLYAKKYINNDILNNRLYDVFLMKLNSTGAVAWGKVLSRSSFSRDFYTVKQTHDGGYICAGGATEGLGPLRGGFLICKFDNAGNLSWSKKISKDSTYLMNCKDIMETSQNEYIFLGDYQELLKGDYYVVTGKIDGSGNLIWSKQIKFLNLPSFSGSVFYEAGNLLFIGYAGNSAGNNAILFKADPQTGSPADLQSMGRESIRVRRCC